MISRLGKKDPALYFFPFVFIYSHSVSYFTLEFAFSSEQYLILWEICFSSGGQLAIVIFLLYPPLFFYPLIESAAGVFKFMPYPSRFSRFTFYFFPLSLLLPGFSSEKRIISTIFFSFTTLDGASFDLFAVVLNVMALLLFREKNLLSLLYYPSFRDKIYPLIYLLHTFVH